MRTVTAILLALVWMVPGFAGTLSDNLVIDSQALGYKLQYRVYTPDRGGADLPVLYLTDGQWYISQGNLPALMDQLITEGRIRPAIAVFVDNRDPDNLEDNRRNREFFCNPDYARFFGGELVPSIDREYPTHADRASRVVLGLSFGGLNSACFGLGIPQIFQGIAMQSPAMHPVPEIYRAYAEAPEADLKVFLSTGTINDNENQARRLKKVLEKRGHELHYMEVRQGHNWRNWGPLMDDVLEFYFGVAEGGTGDQASEP